MNLSTVNEDSISGNLEFMIDEGWKIYSHNPGSFGKPTVVSLVSQKSLLSLDWPQHTKISEDLGDEVVDVNVYLSDFSIPFIVHLSNDEEEDKTAMEMTVRYAACGPFCMPFTKKFNLKNGDSCF